MKTSTAILLTAFLILLGSLGAYNMALKAEYKKGTYKDPYRHYTALNYRDFDQVEINPATEMNVKIKAGDYQVQVHQNATKFVKITKVGQRLQVDLVYPQEKQAFHWQEIVVITCPQIKNLKANALYTIKGKQVTSTGKQNYYSLTLQGFKQPNLTLQQDKTSAINLSGNQINRLEAIVGWSTDSKSRLNINKTNSIQEANLDIRNKSELVIDNVKIPKLQYQFSDSARATFSGSALGVIAQ